MSVNLTLTATATFSSLYGNNQFYNAQTNKINLSGGRNWTPLDSEYNSWIQFDFGKAYTVKRIVFSGCNTGSDWWFRKYTVDIINSSGKWQNIVTNAPGAANSTTQVTLQVNQSATSLKMSCPQSKAGLQIDIWADEFVATDDKACKCTKEFADITSIVVTIEKTLLNKIDAQTTLINTLGVQIGNINQALIDLKQFINDKPCNCYSSSSTAPITHKLDAGKKAENKSEDMEGNIKQNIKDMTPEQLKAYTDHLLSLVTKSPGSTDANLAKSILNDIKKLKGDITQDI